MPRNVSRTIKRISRHRRIRARILGTSAVPRLAVFRSNKTIVAQLIDDTRGFTLAAASSKQIKKTKEIPKIDFSPGLLRAYLVGRAVGDTAKKAGFLRVKFDRGGFAYHGKIRALAQGARDAGLSF
ncbi:MAG: 50S ribosomal protein L18 [Candidatus Terrybacteria bacterium RIFCSPHIGHO2_01_FULL_48_17]|uniref:Large ribosomal subunit protein uL18 n=1 Tax=Candidatus Terrybacteria bacterium RIFCSPHIGHO2_01_FULL_48_17 TaxID=1802362 RepID=A0A1G2PKW2_9BACT|nr:MAG: 50S ribosomal protein L18 [Candidatus Terrybacteria bacterium RIFCSPHIGHO2_01_FULL_48_17]OHA52830.1 MAG: 50S ribosomal protein L18 [Candidatus Terrybacteria bacterium RIFCSPLOWO2_01_FULL_48_14]